MIHSISTILAAVLKIIFAINRMNNEGSNDAKTYWEKFLELEEYDDEASTDNAIIVMLLVFFEENKQTRAIKWQNERLDWNEHVRRELHTKTFQSKYHMPLSSFTKLVDIIRPDITLDFVKSMNSTGGNTPIYPELTVAMSLRFLGGEHVKSLVDIFGVDDASVARHINLFFYSILSNESLAIKLPQTIDELQELANGFNSISSSDGLFHGCVGAIDGWLCSTIQPIDKDINNNRDYFSGHYQCFGLNIQAICDHKMRFIYFGVAAPGKTGDARAFNKCVKLGRWMEKHLKNSPFFFVGDNAYVLSDELLIPFSGNSMTEAQRTYNFFLSQLRIRIEMAFGRLTTKWRIFRRKLENGMERNANICTVAAILHNYVLNETSVNETDEDFIVSYPGAPSETLGYLPAVGDDEDADGNLGPRGISRAGTSHRRMAFVRIVQRDGMTRPLYNRLRNDGNNVEHV